MNVNEKLELIQKMRQEQSANSETMNYREQLWSGNRVWETPKDSSPETLLPAFSFQSLRLRIAAALLLFLLFFFMDRYDLSFGKLNASVIQEEIQKDLNLTSIVLPALP